MSIANPIEVAKALPRPLLKFFARFPPRNPPTAPLAPSMLTIHDSSKQKDVQIRSPNNRSVTTVPPSINPEYNPFLPWQNPRTGRWREPIYSLREQKEICRMAASYGVEELLPWSIKMSGVKEARRELGSRVKGTGVGQSVKGHKEERQLIMRTEKIRKAMEEMPRLIRDWQLVGLDVFRLCKPHTNKHIVWSWQVLEEMAQIDCQLFMNLTPLHLTMTYIILFSHLLHLNLVTLLSTGLQLMKSYR